MNRAAAGHAALWSAVDMVARALLTLVISVILARLLTPADFGAVAIAGFFSILISAVVQQGLSTAIIQRHGAADQETSSIFWWNLIISGGLAVLLIAVSPLIARFFEIPVLAPLMMAAAVQVVFSALGSVHAAMLARDLDFQAIAKAGIPATAVSGGIGIGLALSGWGVWALAAQLVSAAALTSAGMWIVNRWRPAQVLRASSLPEAVRFARWLGLTNGLEVLYSHGFALTLGKLYGPRDLGLYSRAASTQQMPASVISGVIGRLALPLFAARRDDPEALRRGLLSANRMATAICLPLLAGVALTADLLIVILFGPQWVEAGPVLAILAWAGTLFPVHLLNLQLLVAVGRADSFFRLELAKKLVGIAGLLVGSFYGILGLAWATLALSIAGLFINLWPSRALIGCGPLAQLVDLRGIILATAFMAVTVLVIRELLALAPLFELLAIAGAGGAAYFACGFLLRLRAFQEGFESIMSLRASRGGSAVTEERSV